MAEKIGKFGASGLLIMLACSIVILKNTWDLNNDVWFILNCGRYVVETGTIPHEEFATMHEGLHYVMEQWLTAVIFWKVFANFGANGVIALTWIVGFILMFVYYRLCLYISGGNKKVSVLLSVFVSGLISPTFITTRPQIFSTLLFLIEIFLLEKYFRERKIWTLCALPLLSIILINLHAALWIMLLILVLPFIAESFILNFKDISTPFLPLILAAAGIFLAGFINPYGFEAISFLFVSYNPEIHSGILELAPASIKSPFGFVIFSMCALLIVLFTKKKLPWRYFFMTFGIMILGLYALRNLFLFFTISTLSLAYAAKDWHPFDKIFNLRHKLFIPLFLLCIPEIYFICAKAENSILELHLLTKIIFALSIIFLICFIFFYRNEGKLFSEEIFILRRKPLIALATLQIIFFFTWKIFSMPVQHYEPYKAAADFLLTKNRAEDIILWTGFTSGGYFEFRGIKNYIDARPEIFALSNNHKEDIIVEYFKFHNGELDHRKFFSRYNFTHIFITTEDLIPYLMISQDKENYRLLYEYDFPGSDEKHGRIFVPVKK